MARYVEHDGDQAVRDVLGHHWTVAEGGGCWVRWDRAEDINMSLIKHATDPNTGTRRTGWYLTDTRPDGFVDHWVGEHLLESVDAAALLMEG